MDVDLVVADVDMSGRSNGFDLTAFVIREKAMGEGDQYVRPPSGHTTGVSASLTSSLQGLSTIGIREDNSVRCSLGTRGPINRWVACPTNTTIQAKQFWWWTAT